MCITAFAVEPPEGAGPGLLDVAPCLLANLARRSVPIELRRLCKESMRLYDVAQSHIRVRFETLWVETVGVAPPASSAQVLRSFRQIIGRGCTPKKLTVISKDDAETLEAFFDMTDHLLATLACFPKPQPQLREVRLQGGFQINPAAAAALAAAAPRLTALTLAGPVAVATARGSGDGLAVLLQRLPCLERLTLTQGDCISGGGPGIRLSAAVCRLLRGANVEDVGDAPSDAVAGGAADAAGAGAGSPARRLQKPQGADLVWLSVGAPAGAAARERAEAVAPPPGQPQQLQLQPRLSAAIGGRTAIGAIRHLDLSFADAFAVLAALEGCSQLQSLSVFSPVSRPRFAGAGGAGAGPAAGPVAHPQAEAALRGLASLRSLTCLVIGQHSSGAGRSASLPLVPTLASLPSLRVLALPMWRLGELDLRRLSSLMALESLLLGNVGPTAEELAAEAAAAARRRAGGGAAEPPPLLTRRYALPPRLRRLELLTRSLSVRKLFSLQPSAAAAAAGGPDPPPLVFTCGRGSALSFTSSHFDADSGCLSPLVPEWFRGAVQLLALRAPIASRHQSAAAAFSIDAYGYGDGNGDPIADIFPPLSGPWFTTAASRAASTIPLNKQLAVSGPKGRYLRGPPPQAPPPSALPLLLPAGGFHGSWLSTMAPLGLLSLELSNLALGSRDLGALAQSLPALQLLVLRQCVYPLRSLPRLAAMPSLERLYLETNWWRQPPTPPPGPLPEQLAPAAAAAANDVEVAEAMMARVATAALVALCSRAVGGLLTQVNLPSSRGYETVALLRGEPAGDGGGGGGRGGEGGVGEVGEEEEAEEEAPRVYGTWEQQSGGGAAAVVAAAVVAARDALAAAGHDTGFLRTGQAAEWP